MPYSVDLRTFVVRTYRFLPGIVILGACVITQTWSEALCTTLLEVFSIAFLSAIFLFAWNVRTFLDTDYFLVFAMACMPMVVFEIVHLISYSWFGMIPGGPEVAGRAVLASRGIAAGVLLIAPTYFERRTRPLRTLLAFKATAAVLCIAILVVPGHIYLDRAGNLSPFSMTLYGVYACALGAALLRLNARAHMLHPDVLSIVRISILAGIAANVAFAASVFSASIAHTVGHLCVAASLYLMYKATVEIGLTKPYDLMFRNLKQAEANVRDMSIRDDLTGLHNRRGFMSLAEQLTRMSQRTGRNMLLFYCDVDSLKDINDTLGHLAGDRVLCDTAEVLRQTFRESDIIARTGGDEFLILAIESDNRSVETLRARLEGNLLAFQESAARPYMLGLSIGIATYDPLLDETLEQTLARADSLMYRNKQARKRARQLERSDLRQ